MCEKCGKEIKGESLGLGESFFHASCLTCTTCKENLAGLPVSRDQAGNIYCTRDYDRSPVLEFLNNLWGLGTEPARLHNLAELVPWNRFLGFLKV